MTKNDSYCKLVKGGEDSHRIDVIIFLNSKWSPQILFMFLSGFTIHSRASLVMDDYWHTISL